ncbi:hypothetical protein ACFY8R_11590, partial [Micrococcus luteus]|uniref:hypothetical protein n=1 Tax=Micrococcus luteus TaxID=1270 RepID=UPI0036CA0797
AQPGLFRRGAPEFGPHLNSRSEFPAPEWSAAEFRIRSQTEWESAQHSNSLRIPKRLAAEIREIQFDLSR